LDGQSGSVGGGSGGDGDGGGGDGDGGGGDGDGGGDAALVVLVATTQSNTQAAANNLSRKGRTTCGHRPCGELIGMGVEGTREGPEAEGCGA